MSYGRLGGHGHDEDYENYDNQQHGQYNDQPAHNAQQYELTDNPYPPTQHLQQPSHTPSPLYYHQQQHVPPHSSPSPQPMPTPYDSHAQMSQQSHDYGYNQSSHPYEQHPLQPYDPISSTGQDSQIGAIRPSPGPSPLYPQSNQYFAGGSESQHAGHEVPYESHNYNESNHQLLQTGNAFGPDPHSAHDMGQDYGQEDDLEAQPYAQPPVSAAPALRKAQNMGTTMEVKLEQGNLVLDCKIPPRLRNQLNLDDIPGDSREQTYMRYQAVTCDPSEFKQERFNLRQMLYAAPRYTELFIVITMYNEEDELLARTLKGVIQNIEYMESRTSSKTWGKDSWKKIVVCIVSDGRAKINPRSRAVLAGMGIYQEGIAKSQVNRKDVTAHVYEYTTQMAVDIKKGIVQVKKGNVKMQVIFCLKEKNQKKINSHRWFFQAFGEVLQPNICVLIDAGTRPGKNSIYHLWQAFDREKLCGGACGEIKAMLENGKNLINPLVAAQNFEYKMSNILDKPLESAFGFITVLPGAFSAYRYVAVQNDSQGKGPLERYFEGEKMHGANAGIFTANMYLAEDRILCWELVSKKGSPWILQYVKSATGETDVPTEMADFILQRRRWLNGSFFAAVYALTHFYQIWRAKHSPLRTFMFLIEFIYQAVNMIFAWFAIGNFFLVFHILTFSLGDASLLWKAQALLSVILEWFYATVLVTCFVLALGNRPQGSNKFYMAQVYFWAIIMAYLLFASIFITVKSVQVQIQQAHGFSFALLFTNKLFFSLIVSLASTWALYLVASIMFLDPWHMFTSFIQYLLLTPTYINILNVYAFCNTHDITWGTKGDDKAEKLGTATVKDDGKADVEVPTKGDELNALYEAELLTFATKYVPPKKIASAEQKHEDYYKGFRSAVVLFWVFCNFGLGAVVLDAGGLDTLSLKVGENTDQAEAQRSTIYMSVVLYSVAGLAAVRFIGACWFLVIRIFRGV